MRETVCGEPKKPKLGSNSESEGGENSNDVNIQGSGLSEFVAPDIPLNSDSDSNGSSDGEIISS